MRVLRYLGGIYKELRCYKKSRILLEESFIISKKNYGENHLESARILQDLGQIYFLESHLGIAENLMIKALNILQRNKHPDSYICLEILSEIYLKKSLDVSKRDSVKQSQNFRTQAINYLKQALKTVENHFQKDSLYLQRIKSKLKILEFVN